MHFFLFLFWVHSWWCLGAKSWLFTQKLFLEVLRGGPYKMLGIEHGSDLCKANNLPAGLSSSHWKWISFYIDESTADSCWRIQRNLPRRKEREVAGLRKESNEICRGRREFSLRECRSVDGKKWGWIGQDPWTSRAPWESLQGDGNPLKFIIYLFSCRFWNFQQDHSCERGSGIRGKRVA